MAIIAHKKGSGKRSKVSEKSGNFEMGIEWQVGNPVRINCREMKFGKWNIH